MMIFGRPGHPILATWGTVYNFPVAISWDRILDASFEGVGCPPSGKSDTKWGMCGMADVAKVW